jgi:hypothetical protein
VKLLWYLQTADDPVFRFLGDVVSQERVWDLLLPILVGSIVVIGVDAYRSRKELFCEVIYDWPSVLTSFASVSQEFGPEVAQGLSEFTSIAEGDDDIVLVNMRNTGFKPVGPNDFMAPLECDFGEEADVSFAEVLGTRPNDVNASVRVDDSRRVLIEVAFLSPRDTVVVAVRRNVPYTDAQVVAPRIVGTKLRVAKLPRRRGDIMEYLPTTKKYWLVNAALIMYLIATLSDAYSYTLLGYITTCATITLMIAYFYLMYRGWRIRGHVVFP